MIVLLVAAQLAIDFHTPNEERLRREEAERMLDPGPEVWAQKARSTPAPTPEPRRDTTI